MENLTPNCYFVIVGTSRNQECTQNFSKGGEDIMNIEYDNLTHAKEATPPPWNLFTSPWVRVKAI